MKSACMETANNSCCYVAEMHSKTFARIHVQCTCTCTCGCYTVYVTELVITVTVW